MNYLKLPAIIFFSLLTGACKKDFLNRFPQTEISPELFFKSEEDLSLYVNGLMNQSTVSSYLADQNSDNTTTTASIEIKNIMTGTPSSKTISSGWDWSGLRNINYFLVNYNKANVSQETKDHYAGLARYYRAIFYMEKVKRYSDVPWYSGTIDPSDSAALYSAAVPREQVIDSVMADLQFASSHVRDNVPDGTPDIWAVKLFYARSSLFEGTFRKYHPELNLAGTAAGFLQKARDIAKDIMDNGGFALHNTGNPDADYASLFSSQNLSSNKEVILNTVYDNSKPGAASSNINSTVFGDYEKAPSRSLVQAYLMKDGSRYTGQPGYETFTFVQEFQDRDPRLKQTIAYPGWKRITDSKPYVQRLNKNFTGYHQLKGYQNSSTDNVLLASVDFPAYRYAEVLLIYAEALAELGEATQTDVNLTVNAIRSRAGVVPLDMAWANGNPDPVLEQQYPNVSGSQKGLILEIRRERRVEFALEGYRYDDLNRWHAGRLLEKIPEGMYFPGLGKYDMTGDGEEDIILIDKNADIPAESMKEKNSLGETLIYYKAGQFGEDVTVYLRNGNAGGTMVTEVSTRQFVEPTYYYRPIPFAQVVLNPNLRQPFGWE